MSFHSNFEVVSGTVTATILGTVPVSGNLVESGTITIATILNQPINVTGTIDTSFSGGTVTIATILNQPVNVEGTVEIGGQPISVDVSNTPSVTISGQPVNVEGTVEIGGQPISVDVSNTPSVTISGQPINVEGTLEIQSGTVIIATILNSPNVNVQNLPSTSGAMNGASISVGTVKTQLSTDNTLIFAVTFRADPSNTGTIYLGNTSSQWYPLRPGDAQAVDWLIPSNSYALATATLQTIYVIYGGA